jgi:hypothetical protein
VGAHRGWGGGAKRRKGDQGTGKCSQYPHQSKGFKKTQPSPYIEDVPSPGAGPGTQAEAIGLNAGQIHLLLWLVLLTRVYGLVVLPLMDKCAARNHKHSNKSTITVTVTVVTATVTAMAASSSNKLQQQAPATTESTPRQQQLWERWHDTHAP